MEENSAMCPSATLTVGRHVRYDYNDLEKIHHNPSTQDLERNEAPTGSNAQDLFPPVDGGKHAWCFLAAIFLFEAVIWGL